jgi:transcriptional regulator with XRE-family HTH domain
MTSDWWFAASGRHTRNCEGCRDALNELTPVVTDSADDRGPARAGAAVAARRRQLGISQRSLAADGVITAAALIAFEKGRSWPRARTRARLEEVLQWQPGAIDRIRRGESTGQPAAPPSSMDEPTLLAAALTSAAHALTAVVDALPPADDPQFGTRVTATLADLRQLEAVASKAARVGPPDPDLLRALAAIRRHYDGLMRTAANGPDATLGQRVYSVRRLNALTDAEMARACGVSDDVVVRAQAALPLTAEESATLETAVARLNWT